MSTKHSMLELLLLAVRWCSLPLPLSASEGGAVSAYYYGTAVPFITTCWYGNRYSNWYSSKNNRTGYLQPLAAGRDATFSAVIGKTIDCLNRILDNVKQKHNCNPDNTGTSRQAPGNRKPCWNGIVSIGRAPENSFRYVI